MLTLPWNAVFSNAGAKVPLTAHRAKHYVQSVSSIRPQIVFKIEQLLTDALRLHQCIHAARIRIDGSIIYVVLFNALRAESPEYKQLIERDVRGHLMAQINLQRSEKIAAFGKIKPEQNPLALELPRFRIGIYDGSDADQSNLPGGSLLVKYPIFFDHITCNVC